MARAKKKKVRRTAEKPQGTRTAKSSAGVLMSGDLAKVFGICRPFAGVRAILPVMEHFLLSPTGVAATNGRVGIVHTLTVGRFSATIPAEMVAQLAASFPGEIPISLSKHDSGMRVQIGMHTAMLGGFPAEDFPSIEPPLKKDQHVMPGELYRAAVQVVFSALEDPMRPQLNGVWFGKDATAIATDGSRLAWRRAAGATEMFVPAILLERVAGWEDVPGRYARDKAGKLWWFYPDHAVFVTLPEVNFPDCAAIIADAEQVGKDSPGFTADRGALLAALQRLLLLAARQECSPIRLRIDKAVLRLEAQDAGTGHAMVEDIPVKTIRYTRDAVGSVNARYLLQAAERFDEFYLGENAVVAFAEKRAFGHIIMRVRDTA